MTESSLETLAVFLLREQASAIGDLLPAHRPCHVYRAWQVNDQTAQEYFRSLYKQHAQWLLVMTTGIAVRFLDGQIAGKFTDPAVVVMDEACRNVIALLCGHEGGANTLAYQIANIVGGVPVITTATESLKPLILGIGCRKNVSLGQIEACVELALAGRSLDAVRMVTTIDLKKEEPALLAFCEKHKLPVQIFTRAQIAARPWVTKSSAWVQAVVGADGVCEPSALMVNARARLVVPKVTLDGVAVAIADDSFLLEAEADMHLDRKEVEA